MRPGCEGTDREDRDTDREGSGNDREDFAAGMRYALWLAVEVVWKKKVELVGFCVLEEAQESREYWKC